jgi:hypothetical protein
MQKTCENCSNAFQTKDSRQKTCGKSCADSRRKVTWKSANGHGSAVINPRVKTSVDVFTDAALDRTPEPRRDLPAPEDLPAPYAKRVYDMWSLLTGAGDAYTRIA